MSSTHPGNRWLNTVTSLGVFIVVIGIVIAVVGLVAWVLGRGGAAPSTLEVTPIGLKLETSALAILVLTIGISSSLLGLGLLVTVARQHKMLDPQVPAPMPRDIEPTPAENFLPREPIDDDHFADRWRMYGQIDDE
jgi:hypothetical protein